MFMPRLFGRGMPGLYLWIMLIVGVEGLKIGLDISQIALSRRIIAFLSIGGKLRNGNGGKNANDGNDNQQFNERKT